jgi:hypothetical protein
MNVRRATVEASKSDGVQQREGEPIEPMTLGNMRANGGRSLDLSCLKSTAQINEDERPSYEDMRRAMR